MHEEGGGSAEGAEAVTAPANGDKLQLQTRWDEQMDRDSAAGKLDFLFREAESEFAQGLLREWPPRK